jgi:hypothetical protein
MHNKRILIINNSSRNKIAGRKNKKMLIMAQLMVKMYLSIWRVLMKARMDS